MVMFKSMGSELIVRVGKGILELTAFLSAGFGLSALVPVPDGSYLLPIGVSVTMIAIGAPTLFIVSNCFED